MAMVSNLVILTSHIAKSFKTAIALCRSFETLIISLGEYHLGLGSDLVSEKRDHLLPQALHEVFDRCHPLFRCLKVTSRHNNLSAIVIMKHKGIAASF